MRPEPDGGWWAEAHRHLADGPDPLGALVRRQGELSLRLPPDRMHALVGAIVGQQLSVTAAATIRRRLDNLTGGCPTPAALGSIPDEGLLACGLSRAKVRAVRDLADRVGAGMLDLNALDDFEDDAIVERLDAIKGVGPWTAHMFLIFALGRPDVLATTDLGICVAVGRLHGLEARATPAAVKSLAEAGGWHPYATVACLHLWRSLAKA